MPSGSEILKTAMEPEFKLYGLRDCDCGAKEVEGQIDLQQDTNNTLRFGVVCFLCGAEGRSSMNRAVALELWNQRDLVKRKKVVAHNTTA